MGSPEKNKGGRPTKYDQKYNDQVRKLCLLGATDAEIASFFEVSEATLNTWKQEYPKFLESMKLGKDIADANITDRLYQRAMGFEHDSEEIKVVKVGNFEEEVQRVPVRKIYPPEVTAIKFWLTNRQRDKWTEKTVNELQGALTINQISGMEVK